MGARAQVIVSFCQILTSLGQKRQRWDLQPKAYFGRSERGLQFVQFIRVLEFLQFSAVLKILNYKQINPFGIKVPQEEQCIYRLERTSKKFGI